VEIAGELARYFEPTDTESLAAALADEQPLPPGTERALRGRFNWAGSADAHVELYKQIDAR
jgi:hypothetical protein